MIKRSLLHYLTVAALFLMTLPFQSCVDSITSEDLENALSQNREELLKELNKQNEDLKYAIEKAQKEAMKATEDALNAAKEYARTSAEAKAEQAKIDAVLESKAYTDQEVQKVLDKLMKELETMTDDAMTAANAYTDAKVTEALAKAKIELLTEIDGKLTQTLSDAQKYTDEQLQALKDDVIAAINSRIDDIESQVGALETSAESMQESITALTSDLSDLNTDFSEMQQTLSGIEKQIEGFQSELENLENNLNTELDNRYQELLKYYQELQNSYQNLQNSLNGISGKIDDLTTELTNQVARLDNLIIELQNTLKEHGKDIEELKTSISNANSAIEQLKTDLQNLIDRMNGIENLFSERLTGISYIGDFYIDGFPTKKLHSIQYRPIIVNEDETISYETDSIASMARIEVLRFRLAPSGVTASGIKGAELLMEGAEFVQTKAPMKNDVIEIVETGFSEGTDEFLVSVKRLPSAATDDRPAGEIPTVALKLQIADELLTAEEKASGKQPYAVSQYVRLYDEKVPVGIVNRETSAKYHETYEEALLAEVDHRIDYNSTIGLLDFAAAKLGDDILSTEELSALGYDIHFAIPAGQTDVQFASDSRNTIVSDGEVSLGKEIIIRSELVDIQSGKIIRVAWIKFKWVFGGSDMGVVRHFSYVLGCDASTNIMTSDEFAEAVFSKIGAAGITREFFENNYKNGLHTSDLGYLNIDYTNDQAYFYLMIAYNHIGTIIGEDLQLILPSKEIQITLNPNEELKDAMQPISFKVAIDLSLPDNMPAFSGFLPSELWNQEQTLATIQPVPLKNDQETIGYEFSLGEILDGAEGTFVKNIVFETPNAATVCRTWDIQFCSQQTEAGYAAAANGHALIDGTGETAASLSFYFNGDFDERSWFNKTTADVRVVLENTEGGKALLNPKDAASMKQISLQVMASLNNLNRFPLQRFSLCFIDPTVVPEPEPDPEPDPVE